jgi:hypothetical protein
MMVKMKRARWRLKSFLYFLLLIVFIVLTAFFYMKYEDEKDTNRQLKSHNEKAVPTSTTTSTSSTTTTTIPVAATVDIVAKNNDSSRTTSRINTDYAGKVTTTQVPSTTSIKDTVIVVNNEQFADLANQIATTLKGTVGPVPADVPLSTADIVVYVAS